MISVVLEFELGKLTIEEKSVDQLLLYKKGIEG